MPARRRGWAFLLPLAVLFWAGNLTATAAPTGGRLFAVSLIGILAGGAWQFLHRRDMVDRLTHFAAAFTVVAAMLFPQVWSSPFSSSIGLGVGAAAILTGCVYGEQWLRARDRRTRRTVPAEPMVRS
jgi:hypothetical protein